MLNERSYKISFFCAILLHAMVLIFLTVKFVTKSPQFTMAADNGTIIKAIAVDQSRIDAAIAKDRAEKEQQQQAEIARWQKVEQERLAQQQMIEQQKLLQQQKVKEAEALKQQALLAHKNEELALQKEAQELAASKKKIQQQQKLQQLAKQTMDKQLALEREQIKGDRLKGVMAQQRQGEIDKYKAMILDAIAQQWIIPDGVAPGISCEILVNVAPAGDVLDVQLVRSSGNEILDRSAKTAVLKASPLPVPTDKAVFEDFRSIKLTVRPEGVM
jgi:colicin import membrane protein